jgi:integrase
MKPNRPSQLISTSVTKSTSLSNYGGVQIMSKSTANQYYSRLTKFQRFLLEEYKENLDGPITKLKQKSGDPYDVLTSYCLYLQNQNLSSSTLKYITGIAKNFLEFNEVEISPRKFKLKVRLPKVVTKNKEALSKEDIVDILNTCSKISLKTFVMFLASTGGTSLE